jgi:hypothetical protein
MLGALAFQSLQECQIRSIYIYYSQVFSTSDKNILRRHMRRSFWPMITGLRTFPGAINLPSHTQWKPTRLNFTLNKWMVSSVLSVLS